MNHQRMELRKQFNVDEVSCIKSRILHFNLKKFIFSFKIKIIIIHLKNDYSFF